MPLKIAQENLTCNFPALHSRGSSNQSASPVEYLTHMQLPHPLTQSLGTLVYTS